MPTPPHLSLRAGVTEPAILMISRREVEAGDLQSVLAPVRPFAEEAAQAWRFRGQMSLVVDGYESDLRELVDVPEVRTLLRHLEAEWHEWAFFLNQVDDSIKLLVSCAGGIDYSGGGRVEMSTSRWTRVKLAAAPTASIGSELAQLLRVNGCIGVRVFARAGAPLVCAIKGFTYTTAIVVGLDMGGYERRYCFEHREEAARALEQWDGIGHPPGPWIKCKGAGVDLLNPALS